MGKLMLALLDVPMPMQLEMVLSVDGQKAKTLQKMLSSRFILTATRPASKPYFIYLSLYFSPFLFFIFLIFYLHLGHSTTTLVPWLRSEVRSRNCASLQGDQRGATIDDT